MPVHSDENGAYTIREDGTKEYAAMEQFSFSISEEKVIEFDKESGTLSLSMNQEECEQLSSMFAINEEKPAIISIPGFMPGMPETMTFKGVRRIVSLPSGNLGHQMSILDGRNLP